MKGDYHIFWEMQKDKDWNRASSPVNTYGRVVDICGKPFCMFNEKSTYSPYQILKGA
jgi:hypothetical protein